MARVFILRGGGGSGFVGALASHFDDVLGCGEPGILLQARKYL